LSPSLTFNLILLVFVVGGLILGVWMMEYQADLTEYALSGWLIISTAAMWIIKCPKCRTPVVFKGRIAGFPVFVGICGSTCRECGHDLTKPSDSPE